jgi:hypothetical protein
MRHQPHRIGDYTDAGDLLGTGLFRHLGQEQFSPRGKVCSNRQISFRPDSGQIRSEQLVQRNRAVFPALPVRRYLL